MQTLSTTKNRIESIDFLRGFVMILMALDHVRVYFHFDAYIFNPTDLQRTTPALFITRLMTHLCAPTFILLAGTSAYFIAQRKTLKDTSIFLLTRGVWLVLLQVTIIQFAWNFDPGFHFTSSNIISTIGFSMIALSLLIHLQFRTILIIALVMIVGHNTLDTISVDGGSIKEIIWSFLHVKKLFAFGNDYSFSIIYPVIPWIGVMALGYCLGRLYDQHYADEKRKRLLLLLGMVSLTSFVVLRWANIYGDPKRWGYQSESSLTIMSFFNLEKYPPSLLYLCLTLGISLVLLGLLEGKWLERWRPVTLFGKVALFYYVLHIYAIHLLAMLAVSWTGYPWQTMIFVKSRSQVSPLLPGNFGFSLGETYLIWLSIIVFLYPLCKYWNSFKIKNKLKWWVSYV